MRYLMLALTLMACAAPISTDTNEPDVAVDVEAVGGALPLHCNPSGVILTSARFSAYDALADDGRSFVQYGPSPYNFQEVYSYLSVHSSGNVGFYNSNNSGKCVHIGRATWSQECRNDLNGSQASTISGTLTQMQNRWYAPNDGLALPDSTSGPSFMCGAGLHNAGLTIDTTFDAWTNKQ